MYYSYDGAGRRVQEISTYNTEKVFVYDAFGRLSAKYSVGMAVPPCTTCYISTDHLGSTRLVTDENHAVVARHDYTPFGEEIPAGYAGRLSEWGAADFVNQKFTGQERDAESGLDFFQARYFSAALGRFNSPDPANAGASLFNPQSWNGYIYVNNNPLTLIDPSGTSPFDGFNPSPDDPCADDPFICGDPGFPYPDFPFPWPSEEPQPQPPPPPPPPAAIVIPHTGGVFAQGQWGSFLDKTTPGGNGPFMSINLADMDFGLIWGLVHWVVDYHGHIPLPPNLSGQSGPALRYCGPGSAGGPPVNQADKWCQAHDECYGRAGLAWYKIFGPMSPTQRKAKATCDGQLCTGIKTTIPNDQRESGDIFLVGGTFGCAP